MKIKVLEKERRDHGLTKAALAKKAGLPSTTVGWIESGRYKPYPVQLERLADALGVEQPETLLDEVEL